MAIANMIANNPAQFNWADEEFTFNTKDYPIGGTLVSTSFSLNITFADVDRFLTDEDFKDAIKEKMATALVKFMIEKKLIEFTKIQDPSNDSFKLHARCYVTSDDQVRILRTHYGST